MNIVEKTKVFISINNESNIKEFHDKLYDNLKILNTKEEKLLLWEVVIIFLYLFTANVSFNNISLGPLSITDNTVILKILPLVFLFVLYILQSVSLQKNEALKAFETITNERFSKKTENIQIKSFLTRIYNPYDFAISTVHSIRDNSSIKEFVIGVILLLPLIIIAISPSFIAFSMVLDLYNNYTTDVVGKILFVIALWLCILILYNYYIRIRANIRNR
jgi:uncharacterized membrane protein